MIHTVVSGGQTGVDRAALRAARTHGFDCGGWCPKGRRAEDGTIPLEFSMQETDSSEYSVRTQLNVRDSNATLILACGVLDTGTRLTAEFAQAQSKPFQIVNLVVGTTPTETLEWIWRYPINILNIAGPRESESPGIEQVATDWLQRLFSGLTPRN